MNKGTSRTSRINKALAPDYIKMDERSIQDRISSTLDYAKTINYFNHDDRLVGNWESFFLKDPIFIMAIISQADISGFKRDNDQIKNQLSKIERISQIVDNFFQLNKIVLHWEDLLKRSRSEEALIGEIKNLKNSIAEHLQKIIPELTYVESRLSEKKPKEADLKKILSENLKLKNSSSKNEAKKGTSRIDDNIIELFNVAFDQIYGNIIFFKETVSKKFNKEFYGTDNHLPHIGLLLTFYELFQYVQEEANKLTKKHLDYYYGNLLQQKQTNALKPNEAMIVCQLKEGVDNLIIDKGAGFHFDMGSGRESVFYADSSTSLNRAHITDIKAIYKSKHEPFDTNYDVHAFYYNMLHETDILKNITDKKGPQENSEEDYPLVFGDQNPKQCDIGFIISSPLLILEKGVQTITLDFTLTETLFNDAHKTPFDKLVDKEFEIFLAGHSKLTSKEKEEKKDDLKKNILFKFFRQTFDIYITHEEGWKHIHYSQTTVRDKVITFHLPLRSLDDQLISFDPSIHEGNFDAEWPCIKFLLNNEATYHPYVFLKEWSLEYIRIDADVSEVSNLNLSNSNGEIDSSIPFAPFGSIPEIASFLRIQNPIILQRNLSFLEFSISWNGLPQVREGFKKYYEAYQRGITNDSFKAFIAQTRNLDRNASEFKHLEFNLFETVKDYLINIKRIEVDLRDFDLNDKILQKEGVVIANKTSLYLLLKRPDIAFGHGVFSQIYAKAAMQSGRFFKKSAPLPNQPYTPIIDQLTVKYKNTAKENVLRKQDENSTDIKLIHVHPFGHVQVFPGSVKSQCYLLPQINEKGNLFIGLQNVQPSDIVSIGFELITAKSFHTIIKNPKISWKYLSNNDWEDLTEYILEDRTKGLIKSGIVKIEIPGSIQFDHTRLPNGKFWIKAGFGNDEDEYGSDEDLNSRVKNIFTQVVQLTSDDILPKRNPDEISDNNVLKVTPLDNKKIEKVTQPMHLVVHENEEDPMSYYSRVSEQLRHKNRGITNWDIERIILEEFKQIEKVRVYGRNNYPNELVKGSNAQIVLIPKSNALDDTSGLNNKLDINTLRDVKKHISKFVSPYVNIEVCNPVFEQLKVRCRIQFNDDERSRRLRSELNKELISFLSPDLTKFDIDSLFEKSFTKTEIFNFIEERPYVKKVEEFSVIQLIDVIEKHKIIDTEEISAIWELSTISAYAILTSAPKHHIEIIPSDVEIKDEIKGIGDVAIGSDFVIINKDGIYIED